MGRRRHRKSGSEEVGIDMTPMLDVVFILLIFFIVTTSFVKESGIDVNRPTAATAQTKERANILIGISEQNEVWIQNRRIQVSSVRANVEKLKLESPESSVVIQADKVAHTGILVQVMDQVRSAGIANVSIAASRK